ncbi:MAG: asparagine synthase (glutamine-hydrolyzing) [Verrucomicrobiae bacterium]|nr:asparagine synthase (glutamine-hydrolyzing) [Verrucomicrobiae bacterium]
MCGIAGYATIQSNRCPDLDRMGELLSHRGPDDLGTWVEARGRVGLAHRRLAILDLTEAGHQPMVDDLTGNVVVLNGEIYNHLEIRQEMEKMSGRINWRSSSDTETLLLAFRKWGIECLSRLRGMFAFALWEDGAGKLWLARDRLGIKPLYFHEKSGLLQFASEVRVLTQAGGVERRLDPAGLAYYARFGSAHDDAPLIAGVRNLPAGHWMCWSEGELQSRRYWMPEGKAMEISGDEAAEAVRSEFHRAVKEHLLADVEVSCFLSGGMDSVAITSVAAGELGDQLHTFTVAFPGLEQDEGNEAGEVARRFGVRHHRVEMSGDEVLTGVREALGAMDLPTVDGVNTYLVSGATRRAGIKVALSGLGGDELFGGYLQFKRIPQLYRTGWLWRRLPSGVFRALLAARLGRGAAADRADDLLTCSLTVEGLAGVYRSFWSRRWLRENGFAAENSTMGATKFKADPMTRLSWCELCGYMRMMLLRDSDVFSMAHALELRAPFLDHRLVELMLRLPGDVKMRGEGQKPLLAAALRKELPPGWGMKPKRGFVLPFERWLKGKLRDVAEEGLKTLGNEPLLRGLRTDRLRKDFVEGRVNWPRFWQWVVLGHWLGR